MGSNISQRMNRKLCTDVPLKTHRARRGLDNKISAQVQMRYNQLARRQKTRKQKDFLRTKEN